MTTTDLIDYVRNLPKADAEKQIRKFLLQFIGADRRGDILRNKFKREMRRKVEKL